MNIKELRQKTDKELIVERKTLLKEQFNLRMQRGLEQAPRPHQFKNVRRDIARINTIIREKA